MQILQVKSPYSQEVVGEYPTDNFQTVQEKLTRLHQAQQQWKNIPLTERIQAVESALDYFIQHKQQIALDITQQMGRPISQSPSEVDGLLERARYLCSIASEALSRRTMSEKKGFYRAIDRSPLGVILIISAWNYPLLVAINSIVPALLAGNTVLLKHSNQTPAIGKHFEKAFQSLAGIDHLLSQIIVDHSTTGKVIEELNLQHVVFTGSVKGGQQILQHTAKKFMQPQLELGGKDAAYVAEDANLDAAVATVIDGAMFNSGQSCCGIERVYVHKNIYTDFIKRSLSLISAYQLGDPRLTSTNLGPLINEQAVNYVHQQVKEAIDQGANVLIGGNIKRIAAGFFYEPTLVVDVKQNMALMQEENFGPVLPVFPVESLSLAVELINDSQYGLTAAIFTQDQEKANIFAANVNTGTIFMNRCDYLDPALPWTGVKHSGCGSALSYLGFLSVTRAKALHFKEIYE